MEPYGKQKSIRTILGGFKKSDFTSWSQFIRSPFLGWFSFILFVAILSLVLSFQLDYLPSNIQVGRIAPKDIKADRNYEIVDPEATEENRRKASESVLPIFDYNSRIVSELEEKITNAFNEARVKIKEKQTPKLVQATVQGQLGIVLPSNLFKKFYRNQFSEDTEKALRHLIVNIMQKKIVASRSVLPEENARPVLLRDLEESSLDSEITLSEFNQILSLEEIPAQLNRQIGMSPDITKVKLDKNSLIQLASLLVVPNTTFNLNETESRRRKSLDNIPNAIIKIDTGEAIIRAGDRYEAHHLMILEGIRKQKSKANFTIRLVGTGLFVFLLLLITFVFSKKFIRKFNPTRGDLYFLGIVLVLLLLIVRLAAALSDPLRDLFPYDVPIQAMYYAIPVAGGAMLTRYILNSEVALVFAIVASALTGLFLQSDLDLSIYYLISGIVAAGAIAHVDRRSAILKAGLIVGGVNALTIVAIKLVSVVSVTNAFNVPDVSVNAFMGFLGGLYAAFFVMVLSPVIELIFNYVPDIKLLELGNLNHPLLRKMIVQAPGTYHHSQLVAVLSEAAAAAIGANPLLARVGSYFHDIGKMRKPGYFIENQQSGENRHDNLTPSMSALIIAAHVKDGLEMAKEYKLPGRIADFIPQHQGTKIITYFYKKAVEQNRDKGIPVDEKHYRYSGPRPQTREAGIILLADGVEAGVRSMPEKTPQKINAKVHQIINQNFTEEQLDECDMTLKNLHVIAETFTRTLVGIYHQRIQYPELENKKPRVAAIKGKLSQVG